MAKQIKKPHVVHIYTRVDDAVFRLIDLLVESGLYPTYSTAAYALMEVGLQSPAFEAVRDKLRQMVQLRNEIESDLRRTVGVAPKAKSVQIA